MTAAAIKRTLLEWIGTHDGGKLTAPQRRFAYLGLAPILAWAFVFVLFPIFWVVLMSLFSYTPTRQGGWFLGLGGDNPYVGLGNYIELFTGNTKSARIFRQAIWNTILFSLLAVPLSVGVALPMAIILESVHQRVKVIFRFIYFLPVVTGSVAVTIIWSYVYAPNWGLLSQIIKTIGLTPPRSWLSDPSQVYFGIPLAMIAVTIVYVWVTFGYNTLFFIAALQGIPSVFREAARIDGANPWQEFWHIVIPLLRRTILLASVLTVISSMQQFVLFWLLTRGGPAYQTQTILLSVYQNAFAYAENMGMAAAMSMFLFIILLILTIIQFRLLRAEWEF
ncbi:carbohydrate ABC transporter permease [Thermoflexus sp.]|uniref:carbohydrate ABC transporter permease n=1 Tax=Thermoflexus sp. TaxID=1969742 RepID=UPI0025D15575|nr:sugar ABC transporter permease [Thermoflexus sp.]MDW8180276.1 sugar ABC transporter permease [Anaerolineae bacterium]MCS6963638.1 sugar ABC transporter permease [Thermoflexus sp.]MCS7350825.1 sugar ABC transporter permease [Thermoflexus sp.]MCX7690363.1 sugar ABC transporter permease [Thermoflexus sp.]MDW8185007.1 sugar ABC transporter permease [Anaerolineae bacterium]